MPSQPNVGGVAAANPRLASFPTTTAMVGQFHHVLGLAGVVVFYSTETKTMESDELQEPHGPGQWLCMSLTTVRALMGTLPSWPPSLDARSQEDAVMMAR